MNTDKKTYFEETRELITTYIEDKILLLKLEAAEKTAKTTSAIVRIVVAGLLLFLIMLMITFLGGYYLSKWIGSIAAGFGIMILLYTLLIFIFNYSHRKFLSKVIVDKVIALFFKEN